MLLPGRNATSCLIALLLNWTERSVMLLLAFSALRGLYTLSRSLYCLCSLDLTAWQWNVKSRITEPWVVCPRGRKVGKLGKNWKQRVRFCHLANRINAIVSYLLARDVYGLARMEPIPMGICEVRCSICCFAVYLQMIFSLNSRTTTSLLKGKENYYLLWNGRSNQVSRAGLRYCCALSTWHSRCPLDNYLVPYTYTNTIIRTLYWQYCTLHMYGVPIIITGSEWNDEILLNRPRVYTPCPGKKESTVYYA